MAESPEPRDEGAAQTRLIMRAAKSQRRAKGWSAERLAAEMAAAGVSWNASIVNNLELGRRRSLRVHELLTMCYVLEVNPLEVLVPPTNSYPVTPNVTVTSPIAKAWMRGEIPSLRTEHDDAVAKFRAMLKEANADEDAVDGILKFFAPMLRSVNDPETDG